MVESEVRRNLLVRRFTLQIENLAEASAGSGDESGEEKAADEWDEDEFNNKQEWQFRDSLLKCLYSQDAQYPASRLTLNDKPLTV
jgi:hypothetical protein